MYIAFILLLLLIAAKTPVCILLTSPATLCFVWMLDVCASYRDVSPCSFSLSPLSFPHSPSHVWSSQPLLRCGLIASRFSNKAIQQQHTQKNWASLSNVLQCKSHREYLLQEVYSSFHGARGRPLSPFNVRRRCWGTGACSALPRSLRPRSLVRGWHECVVAVVTTANVEWRGFLRTRPQLIIYVLPRKTPVESHYMSDTPLSREISNAFQTHHSA